MNLTIEKKLIFGLCVLGLTITTIGGVIIYPTIKQIYQINQETTSLRAYLERRHDNIMSLKFNKVKISEIKETVAGFLNYFYYPEQELKLINELEILALNNNVSQKIENFEASNKHTKITLDINGPYENVVKYLFNLEKLPNFLNTEQIYLSGQDKPNQVNLRLDLNLYVNNK